MSGYFTSLNRSLTKAYAPGKLTAILAVTLLFSGCASISDQSPSGAAPAQQAVPTTQVKPVKTQAVAPKVTYQKPVAKPKVISRVQKMPSVHRIKKSVTKAHSQAKQMKTIIVMHSPKTKPVSHREKPVKKVIVMTKKLVPVLKVKPTRSEPDKVVVTTTTIKKAPPIVKPVAKPIKKTIEKPIRKVVKKVVKRTIKYGKRFGSWSLEKNWDAEHSGQCRLKIGTKQVMRNSVGIQYWVSLQPSELKIYTTSTVNSSISGTGIKINKGSLIPFTRVDNATNPVLKKDILSLLKRGKTLNIYLGFSYITPKRAPQHIRINLKKLDKGIPALKACNL